jgi:hypothetical protein
VGWNGGAWLFAAGDNRWIGADILMNSARLARHHWHIDLVTLFFVVFDSCLGNHPIMLLVGCGWVAAVLYLVKQVATPAFWIFVPVMAVIAGLVAWQGRATGFVEGGEYLH